MYDLKQWGYKCEMIKGAICYVKKYTDNIDIVIFKKNAYVRTNFKFLNLENIKDCERAIRKGNYEYRVAKKECASD